MKRKISEYESNMEGINIYNDSGLMNIPKKYIILIDLYLRTKYKALEDVRDLKVSINNIETKELKRYNIILLFFYISL